VAGTAAILGLLLVEKRYVKYVVRQLKTLEI
jgi:hypothetical protein